MRLHIYRIDKLYALMDPNAPKNHPICPPLEHPNGSKCDTKSDMQTIRPPRGVEEGGGWGGGPPPLLGPQIGQFWVI